MADLSFATIQSRLETVVETVSGLTRSLRPLDPTMDPGALQDKRYAVELATTNTHQYRDKDNTRIRVRHDAVVRFLRRLPPKDQNTRYTAALGDELLIIQAFSDQVSAWQRDLRVTYETSDREVLPDGEWLLISIAFEIHHDLDLS